MDERDMLQWLKEEAEEIKVPEELHPNNIKKKLEEQSYKNKQRIRKQLAVAASLVLCCGVIFAIGNIVRNEGGTADFLTSQGSDDDVKTEEAPVTDENLKAFGKYYMAADNYGEVYDVLQKYQQWEEEDGWSLGGIIEDFFDGGIKYIERDDEKAMESSGAMESGAASPAAPSEGDYSKTNLQTEGVDESDIVKTDGKYIYAVQNGKVTITDIQNDALKTAGVITAPGGSASDTIREMYVDGDKLFLIAEVTDTSMKNAYTTSGNEASYYVDSKEQTVLYTYDISDRTNPKLAGTMKQDGYYETSRKIDDIIYLFTEYYMELPETARKDAVKEENTSSWLPRAGGEVIACGNIYLPERGAVGKLITSVDVNKPDEALDTKLMVTDAGEIYVSNESIYIYGTNWETDQTEIAKFSLQNGKITGVAAASVKGEITDTFAINEYDGHLRVLTTDWSMTTERSMGDQQNCVFVLDENLKLCGQITGLARGEQIYSARFLGNTGYFVTYRNTDPLFTVDFSDPSDPQIKGELKVTGFSEYLHFWGENKLLGIGYETDPDTGNRMGMKLSMFDISDPCNVKEESRYVLKNVNYSPALYDYKCVLADKEKNLIGFAAEKDDFTGAMGYLVFSYDDGFQNIFTEEIENGYNWSAYDYRGIYVGSRFYLVGGDKIVAYDMDHGFERIAK